MKDYGFELPDRRYGFIDTTGETISVHIMRDWYMREDDEMSFKVSFRIVRGSDITHLPTGCNESKAIKIAHELYQEDQEATLDEIEAEQAAEHRVGA